HILKTVFFFSCRQGTKVFSQKRLNLRGVYITYKCKVHTVSNTKNLFVDSKRTICIQFVIVSFVWNAAGPGIVVVNNFCECITEKCPRVLHDKLYLAFLPVNIRLKQAFVFAWLCKIQMSQLQESFKVFNAAASFNPFFVRIDVRMNFQCFSRKEFTEIGRREVFKSHNVHQYRSIFRVFFISEVEFMPSAPSPAIHQYLIIFESGRLQGYGNTIAESKICCSQLIIFCLLNDLS